jgi:hypothetical protein
MPAGWIPLEGDVSVIVGPEERAALEYLDDMALPNKPKKRKKPFRLLLDHPPSSFLHLKLCKTDEHHGIKILS